MSIPVFCTAYGYNLYIMPLTGNSVINLRNVVCSKGFRRIAVADGRSLLEQTYMLRICLSANQ